jgi:hypothetical protein
LHKFLISPMRATCPDYLILFHLFTLKICGEAYKLWSSSLCSVFHPPVTFSYVQIFFSAPRSKIFCLCSSLSVRDQVWNPHKKQVKIWFRIF